MAADPKVSRSSLLHGICGVLSDPGLSHGYPRSGAVCPVPPFSTNWLHWSLGLCEDE